MHTLEIFLSLHYLSNFYLNNFLYDVTSLLNNSFFNISYLNFFFNFFFNNLLNFFTIFFTILSDYLFLKSKKIMISTELIYGFSNIHPFLVYFSTIIFFIKKIQLNNQNFFIKLRNLLTLYSFSLLFGSIWGVTNFAWGFFWLNDPIEIIILFMCLFCLYIIHINLNNKHNFVIFFFSYFIIVYLLFFRLGFISTRHSFFNLENITDLYVLNFFLIFFFNFKFSFFFLSLILLLVLFKYYFILYFIKGIGKKLNKFSFIFTHVVILIFFLNFLRYKENNLSSSTQFNKLFLFDNFFYFFNNKTFNFIYIFNKIILLKFYLIVFYSYPVKLTMLSFKIFLSYWNFATIILVLISNIKIVSK